MFRPKKNTDPLDEAINRVMLAMTHVDEDSEDYKNLLVHLTALSEVRAKIRPKPLSTETIITAGASLLGVVILVGYEHGHAVVTKAIGLLPKPSRS